MTGFGFSALEKHSWISRSKTDPDTLSSSEDLHGMGSCCCTEKGISESSAQSELTGVGAWPSQPKSFLDSWEASAVGMSQCSGKNKNVTI